MRTKNQIFRSNSEYTKIIGVKMWRTKQNKVQNILPSFELLYIGHTTKRTDANNKFSLAINSAKNTKTNEKKTSSFVFVCVQITRNMLENRTLSLVLCAFALDITSNLNYRHEWMHWIKMKWNSGKNDLFLAFDMHLSTLYYFNFHFLTIISF